MNRSALRWRITIASGVSAFLLSTSMLSAQTPAASGAAKQVAPPASAEGGLVEAVRQGDREAVRSLLQRHVNVNAPEADGATALAWAVYRDDMEAAGLLMGAGANVNAANDYGVTPLSLACANGNAALVEKLLKAGANANAARWTGETVLMRCARTGNVEAVKSLLASRADPNAKENRGGQTALMWALAQNHPGVVRELIDHGADVRVKSKKGFTPLMFAAEEGDLESAKLLVAAGATVNDATPEDGSALMVAIVNGHEDLSLFLLDKGADAKVVDDYGITALHWALVRGICMSVGVQFPPTHLFMFRPNMRETVKALLAHGADPNARIVKSPMYLTHAHNGATPSGPLGATPFFLAALTRDATVMRMLAAAGADPKVATGDGVTPLMAAVGMGKGFYDSERLRRAEGLPARSKELDEEDVRVAVEAVQVAVETGSDVNAANKNGQTALHIAAKDGSNAIVQYLAAKGANLDQKDKLGQTALSLAKAVAPPGPVAEPGLVSRVEHKSTADLLLKLGATPLAASASAPAGPRSVAAE